MDILTKRSPGRPRDESLTARRQEEILDAAARIFAKVGFADADLQVVADELGVSKGTLYHYFPSKRELFLACADWGMRRLKEQVESGVAGLDDPLLKVAEALRLYFAFFDANPEFVELLIQERAAFKDRKKPTYLEHCEANIAPWQALFRGLIGEGRVRDIPVEQITDVMSNLAYGTIFMNFFAGRHKSLEGQTQEILDIIFNGILTGAEHSTNRTSRGGETIKAGAPWNVPPER